MKNSEVVVGESYIAKVSGKRAAIQILSVNRYGGWDARNLHTHRNIRIRSAQRLHPLPKTNLAAPLPKTNLAAQIMAATPPSSPQPLSDDPARTMQLLGMETQLSSSARERLRVCDGCFKDHNPSAHKARERVHAVGGYDGTPVVEEPLPAKATSDLKTAAFLVLGAERGSFHDEPQDLIVTCYVRMVGVRRSVAEQYLAKQVEAKYQAREVRFVAWIDSTTMAGGSPAVLRMGADNEIAEGRY